MAGEVVSENTPDCFAAAIERLYRTGPTRAQTPGLRRKLWVGADDTRPTRSVQTGS